MKIIIIGAIGKNNELGKNNKLLWNLKKDLEFFKNITLNHTVVMGYNTYKSLPKKLENRKMIVLTSKNIKDKDIITYKNEYELLKNHANEDLYIIGGAQVYKTFLEYADELYLTQIEDVKEADTYFPTFNKDDYDIKILKENQENNISYKHMKYTRINSIKIC